MAIELKEVKSSNISHIGYSMETHTLYIRFKGSQTLYSYADFPSDEFQQFEESESKGKFFAAKIKPKFTGVKVDMKLEESEPPKQAA